MRGRAAVTTVDPRDLERDLREATSKEKALRWDEAAAFYGALLAGLAPVDAEDRTGRGLRATLRMRHANALMELGRWDEARRSLDEALGDAKASGQDDVLGQALIAAGVFAANRDDNSRAEAFLRQALDLFHRRSDRPALQGRGWAFINLATLYGKTGRLDLAFVTMTKAQDVLGAAENWAGVAAAWEAQAQIRRAIGDEDRWREDLAEAIIFYDREGMNEKADRLRAMIGRKLV